MDQVIWVEVLSRHRGVISRQRCTGRGVRIGRAYTNDVILDDPYIAPEHLHIAREEDGTLVAEDLGSVNGIYADHSRKRLARLVLADDTVFRVGHSHLRVRQTEHEVAPERQIGGQVRSWPLLGGLAVVVLGFEAAVVWLGNFTETTTSDYVMPLAAAIVFVTVWAALWSIASRIFAGQTRFERNLLVALCGALGFEATSEVSALGAFGLSWSALATYSYAAIWCLLALMCFIHLRLINPARTPLKAAIVLATLGLAITLQTVIQTDSRPRFQQSYVRRLLPPALRLSRVEDEASFFAAVQKLQGQLDEDRAEAP